MAPKRYKTQRRLKPKRSRLKKILRSRFFWFGMAGCFVSCGIIYGLFFTPLFSITQITVQGNSKVPTEKIYAAAKEYLPRSILFLSLNHLLLANMQGTQEEIQTMFPEIEDVSITKKFFHSVTIKVEERKGVAVWCQKKTLTVEESDSSEQQGTSFRECFALDKNGVIFERQDPGDSVIISSASVHQLAHLGDTVVDSKLLEKLLAFQNELDASTVFREVGLQVLSFSVVSEQRVNATISEGWDMYLNPSEDIDWQATKAKLVLEQQIPSSKRPSLEYVDLRFGDQAYIKYR